MDEQVNIVDKDNNILYQVSKGESHQKGLLHETVIAELVDPEGNWTLVKQAAHKQDKSQYVSPVGGHVTAGESWEQALKSEASEEIGITNFKFKFINKAIFNRPVNGHQENHYFIVYEIYANHTPKLNDESVSFKKFSKAQIVQLAKQNSPLFGDAFYFVLKNIYHLI
jgi:ADP-ribose pyrophosphatase YjhB (NUDIX family)